MRARNIKPGLFKNEVLGVADPLYTLLFEGLWILADREGRLEDRPLRIKGEVFPYREGLDIEEMLDWLVDKEFIRRYVAAGKRCILICEFLKHQNPHKNESESVLPAPEEIGKPTEEIGSTRADSLIPDSGFSDSPITEGDSGPAPALAPPPPPVPPPAFLGEKNESAIPAKAKVPLAEEWELPERWGNDAEALGFMPPEILREAEKFRQYHVAGKGAGTRRSLKGWRQGWSNWLGNAERFRRAA